MGNRPSGAPATGKPPDLSGFTKTDSKVNREIRLWIDGLREKTEPESHFVGMWTDNDYWFIVDSKGWAWTTETLRTGEQVKVPFLHPITGKHVRAK